MARHRDHASSRTRRLESGGRASNGLAGLLVGVLVGGALVVAGAKTFGGDDTPAPAPAAGGSSAPSLEDCDSTTTVQAVAPSVVTAMLQQAAADECIALDLTEAGGRDGVRATENADLWITDSSLWAAATKTDPGTPTSIASSPVVGIVTPGTAQRLGGGDTISWPTLLSPDRPVRIGFHDPSTTATGLLGAWPLLRAQRDVSTVPFEALAYTARSLAQPAVVGSSVLADPPAQMLLLAGEYTVQPNDNIRVLRGKEGEPYFDFPAYNLSHDPAVRVKVADLITRLAGADVASQRGAAQLRDPDGTAEFDTTLLGTATRRMELPNASSTIKLYGLGASGNIPGRILVLLDVSAAMGQPQANGAPLIDNVRTTALIALSTLYDHTSVGVWLYGNQLDGTNDHTELMPITSLGTGRKSLIDAVDTVQLSPNSGAALYDTIRDGYHTLQQGYDPAAAQSLVIFTNTSADTTSQTTLPRLITQLKTESDPDQHIRIMGVGFGDGADVSGLQQLSDEFGGKSAHVKGPVAMLGLFITMIGQVAAEG